MMHNNKRKNFKIMRENTSDKTAAFSKKKLSFILPAVLTGLLVFDMIPQTQVTLQEIPERLALVEEVAADTGADASGESEKGGLKRAEKKKDDGEQAVGDYEDGVYTGTSQGYGGPVTVEVTVKDGQITDVKIVSAAGETEPYFSLAKSVIDQVKQKQTWEVDVASGATYSSRGILGAIQNALTGETVENAAAPKVEPQGTKQQDSFKDPDAYKDGTYTGTAQGFGGPITVKVVIKDGKIDSISIESAGGDWILFEPGKGSCLRYSKKGIAQRGYCFRCHLQLNRYYQRSKTCIVKGLCRRGQEDKRKETEKDEESQKGGIGKFSSEAGRLHRARRI